MPDNFSAAAPHLHEDDHFSAAAWLTLYTVFVAVVAFGFGWLTCAVVM